MFSVVESFRLGGAYHVGLGFSAYFLAACRAFDEPCGFDGVADERVESGAADVLWDEVESYDVAVRAACRVHHDSLTLGMSLFFMVFFLWFGVNNPHMPLRLILWCLTACFTSYAIDYSRLIR